MSQTAKEKQNYYTHTQGSLASRIDYLPDLWDGPGFQPQVIENPKKTVAIKANKGYTILLFLTIVLCIALCAIYLKSAFSLIAVQAEVNRLKSELEQMRVQNAQLEYRINETVDLEKTYDVAVGRLSMRLPEKHEVHYITRKAGSYTLKLNQATYSEQNNNVRQFILFILKDW